MTIKNINSNQLTPIGPKSLNQNDFILSGHRIKLVPLQSKYLDFIYQCYNNPQFMNLYRILPIKAISKQELQNKIATQQNPTTTFEWVIINNQGTAIGLTSLENYHKGQRKAEFLIGFPAHQSKQHSKYMALEASLLVLNFAFNKIALHKLISFVYAHNQQSQKNTLHLGFKQEGYFEQHFLCQKGFIDLYQNGLLRSDFLSNLKIKNLSIKLLQRDITRGM